MRSLYMWLGVGAVCTLLGASWLGQNVLGQPEPPGLLPAGYPPPQIKDISSVQIIPGTGDLPAPTNPPQIPITPVNQGLPAPQLPSTLNPEPPAVPGPSRFGGPFPASQGFAPPPLQNQSYAPIPDVRPGKIESSVTTEWVGPAIAKLGQPMNCQILVKNNGLMAVHQVVVRHQMPDGVEQRGSEPAATVNGRQLLWNLGTLEGGQTRVLKLQLTAQQRGALNCQATVTFSSASALQVQVREPLLNLKVKGPDRVITGEEAVFLITLSNPGDGLTENISVKAVLPEGLEHAAGRSLEINNVAPLAPKEARTLKLVCMARGTGPLTATVTAMAESNLKATELAMVEIINPKLDLAMVGPKLRFIDRHAVYALKVGNPSSVAASNVTLTEAIPAGFKFHQASGSGRFDKDTRTVTWFVGDLAPGQNREMSLDLVATAPGDHKLVGLVNSARGVKTEAELRTRVEGLPRLEVEVTDTEDPVEVGAETIYKIRVANSGTKMESNVQVVCHLPEQMEFVKSNMRHHLEGHSVVFDPLPNLAPLGGEIIYTVTAKGMQPGNLRVRVQVRADSLADPIMREEVTRVYSDDMPAR